MLPLQCLLFGALGLAFVTAARATQFGECQRGLQPSNSSAVPSFVINLDLSPAERWKEVATAKRREVYRMHEALMNLLGSIFGGRILSLVDKDMPKLLQSLPWTFREEMKALSNLTGLPLGEVILYNVFYEFFTVCTSIVAEDLNGNLYHARNLDFGLFLGWDRENHTWAMTETLRPTVVELDFQRSGKTVFKAVSFAGYLGVLTGVKKGAFSLTINERFSLNGGFIGLLEWILGDHSQHWVGFLTRDLMENATSYDVAKMTLSTTKLLAPVYFILGGTKSGEAAIITRSRNSDHADVYQLSDTKDKWFLLETNYDHWKTPPSYDDRRGPGIKCMRNMTQQALGFKGLFDVLSTQPVLNLLTVYTALMRASTGEIETYIQSCKPPCTPW
ncbi:acid ceramidase isoform X2 [Ixodes scapularis]|uniref:acid ceramidase isoform X2 n=1 Tax=Ixodes scapularis TaxID=6945 RepID=UPI001A9D5A49|nr:acid ceramidase isoform X2 [Ixodes scapularis]